MDMHTIDAKAFQKLFLAGANRINEQKEYINELNVFPVPDGDTGTNMSLTILPSAEDLCGAREVTRESSSLSFSAALPSLFPRRTVLAKKRSPQDLTVRWKLLIRRL